MPRKKRNSGRKPELVFEESPVSIRHGHVSPVLGALNPPTAEVVTIDQNLEVPWVSPQFKGLLNPIRRRSRTVRKHCNNVHNSTADHQTTFIANHRTRIRHPKGSLLFVGEVKSPIVDVSCQINGQDSPNLAHVRKYKKTSSAACCDKTPGVTPIRKATVTSSGKQKTVQSEHDDLRKKKLNLRYDQKTIDVGCDKNSSSETTQIWSVDASKPPIRRLFHVNCSDEDDDDGNDEVLNSFSLRLHVSSPHSAVKRRPNPNIKAWLFSTPTDHGRRGAEVLVDDTPEAEYGLSARERRRHWRQVYSDALAMR